MRRGGLRSSRSIAGLGAGSALLGVVMLPTRMRPWAIPAITTVQTLWFAYLLSRPVLTTPPRP